ncbi:HWE histidine kinase domain-containing protein [Paracraurococcus lichenis]|uniref:histidine kinase n=1 Tax=Paracraurococcus lichenis TaxID=3064888 RepID=A0ABT9ED11_9PROT|nr:HWE histidine kinase domain-containing protein [Paracraurococcus sp. LOR1-02]MDO9714097.1 HWE histidine kinase domain-containing protein [Paracraurococcus sp. LOR1-02]
MTAFSVKVAVQEGSCRILHLEDSPVDAELIAEHLARPGLACTIRLVATRATYSAALIEDSFDIILADYVLPDFDGLAALMMARDLAPDTPFIFVSGTLGEEAAVEAVKRGATDYVVKQRLARLPVAVERAMAETRARSGQRETLAALRESEARLRLALSTGRLGAWELDLRTFALKASETCLANFGRLPGSSFTYDDLRASIHPDDREAMQTAVARSIAERMDYDIEYRAVWPDGTVHWVQVRGQPVHAADGTPLGMAGVSLDVTERKVAEQRQALLSREVDHRAKNALAVVQAALRLTTAADMPDYIRKVEGRVAALARTQTLLAEDRWSGADLHAMLQGELAPFLSGKARVALNGLQVSLPAKATQPLAMAIHELATNAVKYGALSVAEGGVSVSWVVGRSPDGPALLRLRWVETGGPPITGIPKRRGFGGRVLDGTVRVQLGGKVLLTWEPTGLVCSLEVPLGLGVGHQAEDV